MNKFKAGDRVRLNNLMNSNGTASFGEKYNPPLGTVGTVSHVGNSHIMIYHVTWDTGIRNVYHEGNLGSVTKYKDE